MIAAAPHIADSYTSRSTLNDPRALHAMLEEIEVATGARCTADESRRFLQSAVSVTRAGTTVDSPTAQDMECLRQATFKYRLETGADKATASDLMPTLQRLGYV